MTVGSAKELLGQAWSLLDGSPELLQAVNMSEGREVWTSCLDVTALAQATVASAALAAGELAAARQQVRSVRAAVRHESVRVEVDGLATAAAFASEWHLRLGGRPQFYLDPLSKLWPTSDGWIRTHANYPHHRGRLLAALGVSPSASDPLSAVGSVLAERSALHSESAIVAAGGVAAAARSSEEWQAHPQGRAVEGMELLSLRRVADAPPRRMAPAPSAPLLPAAGVRVLDFTRVIAGPVGTRTLAFLGADVLRVDSPRLPELDGQHLDSDLGKRSALLDLEERTDRDVLARLIADADVLVTGYRPAALDRYGLGARELLEGKPSLIVVSLSAWGAQGPWSTRRGFDSLVQVASGIASMESRIETDEPFEGRRRPGALPVQALDHATGYLLAATVLRALTLQLNEGGGWHGQLSLAQVGAWLMRHPRGEHCRVDGFDPDRWVDVEQTPRGELRYVRSPIRLEGGPRAWREVGGVWGADEPRWLDTSPEAAHG